jgi:hypothetical protein
MYIDMGPNLVRVITPKGERKVEHTPIVRWGKSRHTECRQGELKEADIAGRRIILN